MSGYTSFAVAGAGGVGSFIAKELVRAGVHVVILSRTSDSKIEGSTTKAVDYENRASLETALSGVEVVISALAFGAAHVQPMLADAAKQVGVSLFLPAEFGTPTHKYTAGPMAGKPVFHRYLKSIDLPYMLVYSGPFNDVPRFDWKTGKGTIIGTGDTPIGFTSRPDVGYYTVQALLTRSRSALAWSTLRLEGDRKTFNEVVDLHTKLSGKQIEITHVSTEEAEKMIEENPVAGA
ncbi:NAD P-binding protein [Pseudohyphozyma bogoriensis]|nr:NAD P-binding protein [Pseudohyphozyma bogoriensis]